MKLRFILTPLFLFLLAGLYYFPIIRLPYNIRSQGAVYPVREWVLVKSADGLLVHTLHDHFNNTLSHHAVTEFQRGDHGEFVLNPDIFRSDTIFQHDTIGFLRSNEEQRHLLQLQGQLEVNRRLLASFAAGERAEDVAVARERMDLATTDYENQKRLLERSRLLFERDVISLQEYELTQNEYSIKMKAMQIAQSEFLAIQAGVKPQELEVVQAEIRSLEKQINQLRARIDAFTIRAPFNGIIIREASSPIGVENILCIADNSALMVLIPVETHLLPYIETGQKVTLTPQNRVNPVKATIVSKGNSIHIINNRQNVYVTAVLDQQPPHILLRMMLRADINTGNITIREYIARISRTIYAN